MDRKRAASLEWKELDRLGCWLSRTTLMYLSNTHPITLAPQQVQAGLFDGLFGNSQADMEKEEAYR